MYSKLKAMQLIDAYKLTVRNLWCI